MSDYEFKCGDCEKFVNTHSTGDIPDYGDKVECINCGRVSKVTSSVTKLFVVKTEEVKKPSQLEKVEIRRKENINKLLEEAKE